MKRTLKFKTALNKLEKIIDNLDQEIDDLDAIIGLYEEGSELVLYCLDKLNRAESKIEIISNKLKEKK